jgi:deoxyadenosine/deoxycytidine kinase
MPLLISIEGNIGCGKSTFLSYLTEQATHDMPASSPVGGVITGRLGSKSVIFVPEPVSDWETIKDESGTPMLTLFYKDQNRNAFSFQMMAYISRLVAIKRAMENDIDIVITERCLYTDKEVFAKMLYEDKAIREVDYQIYLRWFEEFAKSVRPDHILYLSADPETCLRRTRARSRDGEDGIPLEYLARCHAFHETWLRENRMCLCTHIVNANTDNTVTTPLGHPKNYHDWVGILETVIRGKC